MSRVLTNEQNYYDIADTIRQMKNVNTTYKPREMASALKDIYSNEVEGTLPLSFEANGNDLLDYRIDGASGGVGDRTGNLFDGECFNKSLDWNTGDIIDSENQYRITTSPIFLSPGNYTIKSYLTDKVGCATYNSNMDFIGIVPYVTVLNLTIDQTRYIRILCKNDSGINPILPDKMQIMLNSGSTALPYEPYGYKVPVVVSGKNLLKITTNSFTLKGVTFTVNNDKSITCNGTASSIILIEISNYFEDLIVNNEYIFSGCPSTGSISTYRLQLVLFSGAVYNVYGGEKKFTYKEEYAGNPNKSIRIVIEKDCVCNNLTFYPMMRLASIEDDTYEPYIEETTNIYLDEPILENESISLSDTNVDIPTIDGTNTLSINTTVQPSNVYVQIAKNNVIKNWEEIGYFIEPNIINNSFNYAKQIMQNWDNTLTDYTRKFAGDLNLRIMPLVDTLNGINFSNMFLDCNCLVAIAKLNLSNGVSFNSMFSNCYSLVEVPQLNISKGMSFYCMFSNCYSLTTIPQLNASSGLYFDGIFSSCYCLVNFGGLLNIGQAYETSESSNSYGYELDLSSCWQLTHDSLMNVINKLYDIATKGCNTQQLVLGSTNLAKLSAEEIAIATNKGWSVS